jgi:hypothetical protein
MKTLFAVTHINENGCRVLTFGNCGPHHFETESLARKAMENFLNNNSEKLLLEVYGPHVLKTLGINPVECYDYGKAVHSILDYIPELDTSIRDENERQKLIYMFSKHCPFC